MNNLMFLFVIVKVNRVEEDYMLMYIRKEGCLCLRLQVSCRLLFKLVLVFRFCSTLINYLNNTRSEYN